MGRALAKMGRASLRLKYGLAQCLFWRFRAQRINLGQCTFYDEYLTIVHIKLNIKCPALLWGDV
jgi:hypothetical protein